MTHFFLPSSYFFALFYPLYVTICVLCLIFSSFLLSSHPTVCSRHLASSSASSSILPNTHFFPHTTPILISLSLSLSLPATLSTFPSVHFLLFYPPHLHTLPLFPPSFLPSFLPSCLPSLHLQLQHTELNLFLHYNATTAHHHRLGSEGTGRKGREGRGE